MNEQTLNNLKLLTNINSLTLEEAEIYWQTLLLELNQYNEEIQYNKDEINDEVLLQRLLTESIILQKEGLWGDTLVQHQKNFQRYLNTLTGLGV